jgi:hypothetical protein
VSLGSRARPGPGWRARAFQSARRLRVPHRGAGAPGRCPGDEHVGELDLGGREPRGGAHLVMPCEGLAGVMFEVVPTFECCGHQHEEVVRRAECVRRESDEYDKVFVPYEFVVQHGGALFVVDQVANQGEDSCRDHPVAVAWERRKVVGRKDLELLACLIAASELAVD